MFVTLMADIVVRSDGGRDSQLDSIANAIKTHVKSPNKVSQLTRILEKASQVKGGDISLRDFLRSVGDSDIKEYSLNGIKVEEPPVPDPPPLATKSPTAPATAPETAPATAPATAPDRVTTTSGKHRKKAILLAIFVVLVATVLTWRILRAGKSNAGDACPGACNVECASLNDLAIAKCMPCDHTRACNPKADGFLLPVHDEGAQHISPGPQHEDIPIAANDPTPTSGTRVRVEVAEGVSVTREDRIVFSSLNDVKLTVSVALKDLDFVDNKHTVSLPERTYFATARTVGTKAHFQSSGIVQTGSVIRFGTNTVEVNAK